MKVRATKEVCVSATEASFDVALQDMETKQSPRHMQSKRQSRIMIKKHKGEYKRHGPNMIKKHMGIDGYSNKVGLAFVI